MMPALSLLALLAITLAWCMLPLLPAIRELRRPTDAVPLRIALDHDGNIRHFAHGFRSYMQSQLPGATPTCFAGDLSILGHLQDGTPFVKAKGDVEPALPPAGEDDRFTQKILLSYSPLSLPERTAFAKECYAADTLYGGEGNVYRALLGEKEIFLAPGSMVLRWLHSEGKVQVARDSTLYGRTSSEQMICLAENCRFERLHAPRVEFGPFSQAVDPLDASAPRKPLFLHSVADVAGRRWLIRGDLEIPPETFFEGDLVVTGRLRVGAGAQIAGSVKSHREIVLDPGARIDGSTVSGTNLYLGIGCRVRGPVIAEQEIIVDAGTRLGTPAHLTTTSAPRIFIAPGVLAFGTVWAREIGQVLPR